MRQPEKSEWLKFTPKHLGIILVSLRERREWCEATAGHVRSRGPESTWEGGASMEEYAKFFEDQAVEIKAIIEAISPGGSERA